MKPGFGGWIVGGLFPPSMSDAEMKTRADARMRQEFPGDLINGIDLEGGIVLRAQQQRSGRNKVMVAYSHDGVCGLIWQNRIGMQLGPGSIPELDAYAAEPPKTVKTVKTSDVDK